MISSKKMEEVRCVVGYVCFVYVYIHIEDSVEKKKKCKNRKIGYVKV